MTTTHPARWLKWLWGLPAGIAVTGIVWLSLDPRPASDWFRTPDQQGQRLYEQRDYMAASRSYADPVRAGVALFRAGEFEAAARAFARSNSEVAHCDRGNALVMLGKYKEAMTAYERALALRPNWPAAVNNLEIARLRAARLETTGGDLTGGKLAADEIVFEAGGKKTDGGATEVTDGGPPMSDAQIQALWLRRIQTRPADFLRARFAYQRATHPTETPE
jgi:Ca-activated chloride channel homolog